MKSESETENASSSQCQAHRISLELEELSNKLERPLPNDDDNNNGSGNRQRKATDSEKVDLNFTVSVLRAVTSIADSTNTRTSKRNSKSSPVRRHSHRQRHSAPMATTKRSSLSPSRSRKPIKSKSFMVPEAGMSSFPIINCSVPPPSAYSRNNNTNSNSNNSKNRAARRISLSRALDGHQEQSYYNKRYNGADTTAVGAATTTKQPEDAAVATAKKTKNNRRSCSHSLKGGAVSPPRSMSLSSTQSEDATAAKRTDNNRRSRSHSLKGGAVSPRRNIVASPRSTRRSISLTSAQSEDAAVAIAAARRTSINRRSRSNLGKGSAVSPPRSPRRSKTKSVGRPVLTPITPICWRRGGGSTGGNNNNTIECPASPSLAEYYSTSAVGRRRKLSSATLSLCRLPISATTKPLSSRRSRSSQLRRHDGEHEFHGTTTTTAESKKQQQQQKEEDSSSSIKSIEKEGYQSHSSSRGDLFEECEEMLSMTSFSDEAIRGLAQQQQDKEKTTPTTADLQREKNETTMTTTINSFPESLPQLSPYITSTSSATAVEVPNTIQNAIVTNFTNGNDDDDDLLPTISIEESDEINMSMAILSEDATDGLGLYC